MTTRRDVSRRMLTLEAVGFLLIVAIIWMDEYFDLPHLMFGAPRTPVNLGEVLIESLLTVAVGAAVVAISYRAFRRMGEGRMAERGELSRAAAPVAHQPWHLRRLC